MDGATWGPPDVSPELRRGALLFGLTEEQTGFVAQLRMGKRYDRSGAMRNCLRDVPKEGNSDRHEHARRFGGQSGFSAGLSHTSRGTAESLRAGPSPSTAVAAIHDRGPARPPDSVPGGLHGCFGVCRSGAKGGAMIDHNGFADMGSGTILRAAARARTGSRQNSDPFSSNCLTGWTCSERVGVDGSCRSQTGYGGALAEDDRRFDRAVAAKKGGRP